MVIPWLSTLTAVAQAWVQSLVGELKSHKLCGATWKQKKEINKILASNGLLLPLQSITSFICPKVAHYPTSNNLWSTWIQDWFTWIHVILLCQLMVELGFKLNSIYKAYVFRMFLIVASIPYWHNKKKTAISSNYRGSHTAPWQEKKKNAFHIFKQSIWMKIDLNLIVY